MVGQQDIDKRKKYHNPKPTVLLCVMSLSVVSPMYSILYMQQVFPCWYGATIKNLLEVPNIAEALDGAGKTEDIFAKITGLRNDSIY